MPLAPPVQDHWESPGTDQWVKVRLDGVQLPMVEQLARQVSAPTVLEPVLEEVPFGYQPLQEVFQVSLLPPFRLFFAACVATVGTT